MSHIAKILRKYCKNIAKILQKLQKLQKYCKNIAKIESCYMTPYRITFFGETGNGINIGFITFVRVGHGHRLNSNFAVDYP